MQPQKRQQQVVGGWVLDGIEGIPFLKETQTNAEFTCEFIAAINEYVCSNKAIFYG